MNELWDRASTAAGGPARGSGLGPWLGLATQMALLPFRLLGWGLQLIGQPGEGLQRLAGGGSGGRTDGSGVAAGLATGSGFAPPPPAPAWASPLPPPPSPLPSTGTGSAATPASAVTNLAATKKREERHMACDTDLSGTDLKIIEYTIVSVDPNIEEDELRILQPMRTVATTEDMTENGFIAWVIALYFQQPEHRRIGEGENWKQYLRVCYCVQCRMAIPTVDCCQEQANALRDINRTLKRIGLSQGSQGGGEGGALTPTGRGRRGGQGGAE
jgi:hypothetical protein